MGDSDVFGESFGHRVPALFKDRLGFPRQGTRIEFAKRLATVLGLAEPRDERLSSQPLVTSPG